MKVKKADVERIVREELARHIKALMEAKGDEGDEPEVADADADGAEKEKRGPGRPPGSKNKPKTEPQADPDNTAGKPKTEPKKVASPDDKAPVQPQADEPEADDELEKDAEPEDGEEEEDAEDVTGGEIADEVQGKTIQSLTMEPKSKLMPGAQEIVITFNEITDPLRILINKSGTVKFYFRGLHNEL